MKKKTGGGQNIKVRKHERKENFKLGRVGQVKRRGQVKQKIGGKEI